MSANLQSRDPKRFSSAIDLLRDIQSAPRQFRERFLDQEGLDHVTFQTVSTLDHVELERFAFRWKTVGAAPAFPRMEASAVLSHERPEFLDDQSAAEMMRGMYEE